MGVASYKQHLSSKKHRKCCPTSSITGSAKGTRVMRDVSNIKISRAANKEHKNGKEHENFIKPLHKQTTAHIPPGNGSAPNMNSPSATRGPTSLLSPDAARSSWPEQHAPSSPNSAQSPNLNGRQYKCLTCQQVFAEPKGCAEHWDFKVKGTGCSGTASSPATKHYIQCMICNVEICGIKNLEAHEKGKKHMRALNKPVGCLSPSAYKNSKENLARTPIDVKGTRKQRVLPLP